MRLTISKNYMLLYTMRILSLKFHHILSLQHIMFVNVVFNCVIDLLVSRHFALWSR